MHLKPRPNHRLYLQVLKSMTAEQKGARRHSSWRTGQILAPRWSAQAIPQSHRG